LIPSPGNKPQEPTIAVAARRLPSCGIDGIVAHIKGVERERDQLRATIEKLRGVLAGV